MPATAVAAIGKPRNAAFTDRAAAANNVLLTRTPMRTT